MRTEHPAPDVKASAAVGKIYTLGTSRRRWEDFIEILLAYGIERLVDVRSYPKSKLRHFCREDLEKDLTDNGIEYLWLGKELGGLRKGGYADYTRTEEFKKGIDSLESIAAEKPAALMCAERFPWKCHRKWIARELQKRGWRVEHIIEKDRVWIPSG
jgi:uncharacterized protein (DUF488 family)